LNKALEQNKEKLYSDIKNVIEKKWCVMSWEELELLSRIIPYTRDHEAYELLIKSFDGGIEFPQVSLKLFYGEGNGPGSLNSYRKLQLSSGFLFEKVYCSGAINQKKIEWFYKIIEPVFNCGVLKIPRIMSIQNGEKLTILYFDFLELEKVSKIQAYDIVMKIFITALAIDKNKYSDAPHFLFEYESDPAYVAGLERIISGLRLSSDQINEFEFISDFLKSQNICFAHGDLSMTNLAKPNIVLDIDQCGIFPVGYDIARFIARNSETEIHNIQRLDDFYQDKVKLLIDERQEKNLRISFYYFYLIFYKRNRVAFRRALLDRVFDAYRSF